MDQIILEINCAGQQKTEYKKMNSSIIRIGRGYGNDVIFNDPYLDEEHVIIYNEEKEWRIEDQQSQNGLYINKSKKRASQSILRSGDEILIGKTRIRLLSPSHQVSPPKRLKSKLQTTNGKLATLLAVCGVIVLYTLEGYLGTTENVPEMGKLFVWALFFLFMAILWSGFWALISRMIKQHSRFADHFKLICFFYILMIPLSNTTSLLGYLSSQVWVEVVLFILFSSGLFALLLMGHFIIATNLTQTKRLVFSTTTVIALVSITALLFYAVKDDFRNIPMIYGTLKPPFYKVLPSRSIDQFIESNDWVFSLQ